VTDDAVVLTLPWPPSEANPNRRLPWWKLRNRDRSGRATGALTVYREHVFVIARNDMARRNAWAPLTTPVAVKIEFHPPDRRQRDEDNLLASLKPAIDGVVSAGLLAGDSSDLLHIGRLSMYVPDTNPRVLLILTPYNGGTT
jgi:Holliday junction resolvase RusA-like endonuclease